MILIWRLVLTVMLALALWRIFPQMIAVEVQRESSRPERLAEALGWDPEAFEAHLSLGLVYRDRVDLQDLERASEHLNKAVRLNPHSWRCQIELAHLFELQGHSEAAGVRYQRAISLNPGSASDRWRLANFLLRTGEYRESLRQIARTVTLDRSYLIHCLNLLLKLDAPTDAIERVWPRDRPSKVLLLELLLKLANPPDSLEWSELIERIWGEGDSRILLDILLRHAGNFSQKSAWSELLERRWKIALLDRTTLPLADSTAFLEHLTENGRPDEARAYWIQLTRKAGLADPAFQDRENLVWNGDFEIPLTEGGAFNWRRSETTGASIQGARLGPESGSVLRVEFDGTGNPDFSGLRQLVMIPSPGPYMLEYRAQAQGLSTEEGVYFQALDPVERILAESSSISGTLPWQTHSIDLLVPPGVDYLWLVLKRNPSRRIDNRLRGSVSVDSIRMSSRN